MLVVESSEKIWCFLFNKKSERLPLLQRLRCWTMWLVWLLYNYTESCTLLGTQSHTHTSLDLTSWYFTAINFKSCFDLSNSFFLSSNNVSVVILSSCSWVILAFSCSIVYYNITSLQDYYTTSMLPCPSHRQLTVVVRSALTHHHV